MSFLKQLLRPFVEFDADQPKDGKRQTGQVNNEAPPALDTAPYHPLLSEEQTAKSATETPMYGPGGTLAGPLPEHEQYFEKLVEEANARNPLFQGDDFKEFVDSKLDIDGITDEALKYQTAFNIFKNSGLTKEKLLLTGKEYLNIIGRDLNKFQSAHAQLQRKELGEREQLLQQKAKEVHELTQKANRLKKEINELNTDINLAKDKLDIVRNSFLLAGERKQAQIEQELARIARYF